MLNSVVPRSVQKAAPGANGWNMKRSSSLPSTRWSRFLRLLDAVQVGVEVLLLEEGGAVDALQHLAARVAAPVRAGGVQQLEVLERDGVGDVRARGRGR